MEKNAVFFLLIFSLSVYCGDSYSQNLYCLDKGTADVYFCDPLVNGSTLGIRNGGNFLSEGWQIVQNGNSIFYDIGKQVRKGRLSFWVKNIKLTNIESGDNHHLFEGRSIDSCNWQLEDYYLTSFRIYSKVGRNEPIFGQVKFEYGTDSPCGGEERIPNWNYTNWISDKWYHIEIEFDKDHGRLFIDGNEKSYINVNSDCGVSYRYFYIPIKWCVPSIEGVNEAIYAYVSFAGYSEEEPSDAGFDISFDSSTPDAGENYEVIPVLEDHSVHKWEPDIHPADETVLDVEGDENGNFNEGFYLKFNIDSVPNGYEIDEALIFLYCDYPQYPNAAEGGGGDIYFVPVNNWSEKSITWNNKPAFDSQKMDSQGVIKRGNWYRFDVSPVVKSNGVYSFAVMSSASDGGHYLSKEGGKNNGGNPYMRIHLVKSASTETLADVGNEDTSDKDYECLMCDNLFFPDDGSTDVLISDDYRDASQDELFSADEAIYPYDVSADEKYSDTAGKQRETSDESSGCGCSLLW
ncbi:MAG: DNRLRE domain-containing protein [Deltaproteobacteria bacterium]|nr:DNRLRE domain-containing protein [Deltaproteobacteria bacterium]